jgi:hypothetical protein
MNINYMLIDRLIYKNNIFRKSLIPATIIATSYFTYNFKEEEYNDLRPKKSRCDKELTEFGQCLEQNNDNFEKCTHLLEAYKRCLQRK